MLCCEVECAEVLVDVFGVVCVSIEVRLID